MVMNLSIEDSIYGKIDWFFHPVTQTVKPYTGLEPAILDWYGH